MYRYNHHMKKKSAPYQHIVGFSLLEITFVILLVSILLVSTGLYIRNTNEKSAAKKVANQMIYWLNAATQYYAVQGYWPDSLSTLANSVGVTLPNSQSSDSQPSDSQPSDSQPSDSQPYKLQAGNEGEGISISIVLPSRQFATLTQAYLPRAIIDTSTTDKITLYAYTPPVATATLSSPEAQVKGVGYLTFYNCRFTGKHDSSHLTCYEVYANTPGNGSNQAPCVDPLNNYSYNTEDSRAYQSHAPNLNRHNSGLCALKVPQCSQGSIPQIYYAISQFRAPSYPEKQTDGTKNEPYQRYPYQVNAICQTVDEEGKNLGPCGPNLADPTIVNKVYDNAKSSNDALFFSMGFSIRNYQFLRGVTKGVALYQYKSNSRPNGDNASATGAVDWDGDYYDEEQYNWSAIVSYVIGCVPTDNINGTISGGTTYYLNGGDPMPLVGQAKNINNAGSSTVTAYSQDMFNE